MNARLTASANEDHSEAQSLDDPLDYKGKFYLRVLLKQMPQDGIVAAEAFMDGKSVGRVEHPTIELWGTAPEPTEEDPEPVATGGIITFPKAITSKGSHEVVVTLYLANRDTIRITGSFGKLPDVSAPVRPEIEVLVRLGANDVTLDVVDRLLEGESANIDEIEEAIADIGKIAEGDKDLSDLQALASLATGMRDGISAVTKARLTLHKAVSNG